MTILNARGESFAETKADIAAKVAVDLVSADRKGITREDSPANWWACPRRRGR